MMYIVCFYSNQYLVTVFTPTREILKVCVGRGTRYSKKKNKNTKAMASSMFATFESNAQALSKQYAVPIDQVKTQAS